MTRWLFLIYGGGTCLVACLAIPREALVLRTYMTVVPASAGLILYLSSKYRRDFDFGTDVLTSAGVLLQFMLPSLYLVVVPLEGAIGVALENYLDYFPDVALLALISQALFFLGYELAGTPPSSGRPAQENAPDPMTPSRYLQIMLPLICVVWIARIILLRTGSYFHLLPSQFMFESPYYSILSQLDGYGVVVIAGLWVLVFRSVDLQTRRSLTGVATTLTVLELLWYFPSGSREPVAATLLIVLCAYMFARRAFPLRWILVGAVAGLLLLSFMDFYRYTIAEYASPSTLQASVVGEAFGESRIRFYEQDYLTGGWITRAVARLADARPVAAILQSVPSTIPFLKGETYSRILWVLIPRFVYPEKPQMILPIGWGLLPYDVGASSPTTLIGEAYLNFGWLGIVLVLPVVGWISHRYNSVFFRRAQSPVWAAVYVGMAPAVARLPTQPIAIWLGLFLKASIIGILLVTWDKIWLRVRRTKNHGERLGENRPLLDRKALLIERHSMSLNRNRKSKLPLP